MKVWTALFALGAWTGAAHATSLDASCMSSDEIGDPNACSPVVGCIAARDEWFVGQAVGWDEGTLAATTSKGTICTGEWVSRNLAGLGQATFSCDDGTQGSVFFTYQDNVTGTAKGHGLTSDFRRVEFWSGLNIRDFIARETGEVDPTLMCGDAEVPIS